MAWRFAFIALFAGAMLAGAPHLLVAEPANAPYQDNEVAFVRQLEVVAQKGALTEEQKRQVVEASGFSRDHAASVKRERAAAVDKILGLGFVAKVNVATERLASGVAIRITVVLK